MASKGGVARSYIVFGRRSTAQLTFALGISLVVLFSLLAPSVTANTLLCIIGSLQSYQLIYVLTGPINPATQVLSLAIFTQGFGGAQGGTVQSQGYAAAISIVQFVIVAIVSLAALAYLRRRETSL